MFFLLYHFSICDCFKVAQPLYGGACSSYSPARRLFCAEAKNAKVDEGENSDGGGDLHAIPKGDKREIYNAESVWPLKELADANVMRALVVRS